MVCGWCSSRCQGELWTVPPPYVIADWQLYRVSFRAFIWQESNLSTPKWRVHRPCGLDPYCGPYPFFALCLRANSANIVTARATRANIVTSRATHADIVTARVTLSWNPSNCSQHSGAEILQKSVFENCLVFVIPKL